jgi:hypothetical protein
MSKEKVKHVSGFRESYQPHSNVERLVAAAQGRRGGRAPGALPWYIQNILRMPSANAQNRTTCSQERQPTSRTGRPRGSTGTYRARRCVSHGGTPQRRAGSSCRLR